MIIVMQLLLKEKERKGKREDRTNFYKQNYTQAS